MQKTTDFVTLGDLAQETGLNKSKLAYYALYGVLKKEAVFGKVGIYAKKEALRRLKEVAKMQKAGLTLKEMAVRFEEKA